jgi:hypothetical protein
MRLKDFGNRVTIWLSADDTYEWAHRTGAAWPGSTLSGHRVRADYDTNGLWQLTVDGYSKNVDAHELNAIVSDFAAERLSPDHPCWTVMVGQFRG